jgi:iron(III) transport system substrate-binding protein
MNARPIRLPLLHMAAALVFGCGALITATSPAGAASVGGSCSKIDSQAGAGSTRVVCKNTAAAGKRPKLRWTAVTATTVAPPQTTASSPAAASATPAEPKRKLTVYSGRTYGIEDVYKRFTKETGIELEVVSGNDPANRSRLAQEGSRTPADVYLTVDIASLVRAADDNLLSPITSPTLKAAIPAELRDAKNRWFGLTRRARVIYVNTKNVAKADFPTRYEDLATPKWADRVCSRPSSHVYTQSFAANLIAAYGDKAVGILSGIAKNTKSENFIDSDTRIIETVDAGGCDAGIANTYYFFRPGLKRANVALVYPNQNDTDRGVHINVSGAGVVAASDDKATAQRFIEWLATDGSADFANGNAEFPVNPKTVVRDDVKPFTTFRSDQGRIDDYSKMQAAALIVLTDAGWK